MKVVYSTCCGVDIHKTFLVATISAFAALVSMGGGAEGFHCAGETAA